MFVKFIQERNGLRALCNLVPKRACLSFGRMDPKEKIHSIKLNNLFLKIG
jgi:hypothetical protein